MVPTPGASAAVIPNPKLGSLAPLVGTWTTVGRHPLAPDTTFHGQWLFEWLEGGAYLMLRSATVEPQVPDGLGIIGSDDARDVLTMLYFDERGVSRYYEAKMDGTVFRWWRNAPGFSQRFAFTIAPDGRTIEGRGEYSKDGTTWEPDLSLAFSRVL